MNPSGTKSEEGVEIHNTGHEVYHRRPGLRKSSEEMNEVTVLVSLGWSRHFPGLKISIKIEPFWKKSRLTYRVLKGTLRLIWAEESLGTFQLCSKIHVILRWKKKLVDSKGYLLFAPYWVRAAAVKQLQCEISLQSWKTKFWLGLQSFMFSFWVCICSSWRNKKLLDRLPL